MNFRAFSLLLGIPERACCSVFITEKPIDAQALHDIYREVRYPTLTDVLM